MTLAGVAIWSRSEDSLLDITTAGPWAVAEGGVLGHRIRAAVGSLQLRNTNGAKNSKFVLNCRNLRRNNGCLSGVNWERKHSTFQR